MLDCNPFLDYSFEDKLAVSISNVLLDNQHTTKADDLAQV
jgi:hypothetical protein